MWYKIDTNCINSVESRVLGLRLTRGAVDVLEVVATLVTLVECGVCGREHQFMFKDPFLCQ